ncbi:MAG: exonuclease SbcC [Gemella haemolysans]|uniref:exonuclease SbcC n=1 Tax=Gemella haemolysans TaxID=1379 RepID=UPI0026F2E1EC|nr:exonuclease SbcC [Gemella haemolysans]MBS5318687.1 exonuclease SbcC [Gemella haemolysans]
MKFKYHKSYRGFYLLDENKFKRPYQKLDQEKTLKNLGNKTEFNKNEIIEIEDKLVVFFEKNAEQSTKQNNTKKQKNTKKIEEIDFEVLELKYKIPRLLLKKLYSIIAENSKKAAYDLQSVLSVLENITLADSLFSSKVKKIFYYSDSELENLLARYNFDNINVADLKKDIEVNYPSQYISELPIDYKEYEMIFVFYFIIQIELLTILK